MFLRFLLLPALFVGRGLASILVAVVVIPVECLVVGPILGVCDLFVGLGVYTHKGKFCFVLVEYTRAFRVGTMLVLQINGLYGKFDLVDWETWNLSSIKDFFNIAFIGISGIRSGIEHPQFPSLNVKKTGWTLKEVVIEEWLENLSAIIIAFTGAFSTNTATGIVSVASLAFSGISFFFETGAQYGSYQRHLKLLPQTNQGNR